MVDRLRALSLSILAILAPLHTVLLTVLALVVLDLITGLAASIKRGDKIESGKLKRTVVKLIMYEVCAIMSYYVGENLFGPELPLLKIATTMIGITEVKSVFENISVITGSPVFTSISSLISPPNKKSDGSGGPGEG